MLSRRELAEDLRKQNKGDSFVCVEEVKRYMGMGNETVRNFLADIDFYRKGQKKLYHVVDVAKRIELYKCAG